MEEYANEGKPSDGEVYRKIRNYQSQKQSNLEIRWWTLLSPHRTRNLKQLLRHREFTLAFDAFLEIPALLTGMRISTLHKMFAIRCDEEIIHYLRYTKQFWSDLLQQDKTAMAKVDQATVEALQLTAPWASTLDAKILRGKILGGELFCRFSQQEREGIWIRLQSFKGLVPSLFEIFENIKCLEVWADCLKWLVCLGPRETLSTALKKIYTGTNQNVDSALVQKNETTFESMPGTSVRRIDLGHRQLYAFAMRYHCEIPKKPSGKDLLAKPRAILDTARLREMADLATRLGFESSEITALKEFPKSAGPTIVRGNEKPALVTDGPGEIRKDRCGLPHTQSYEEDRKFLFITHLHDDRDEQSEGITSYFRQRSIYLKFYGMPDDSNLQQNLTTATGELVSSAFRLTRSTDSPREDRVRGAEHIEVDGEQIEDTIIQDREGEGEEPRPSFQAEGALAQEMTMQRQKLLSEAGVLERMEYEQEQYRQKLTGDANALVEEEQQLEHKRQKLLSNASILEKQEQEQELHRQQIIRNAGTIREQEQEQEQRRQQLLSHTNILEKQGQEQEQYRQKLVRDTSAFEEQDQEKEHQRQKLLSDASTLEKQEQEQKQYRQRLSRDAIALREQEQEQERRRQKLISDASALKEGEEEQEQRFQKLTGDASALREQEQKREEQRQALAREEKELLNRKQRHEEQQQTLAADASELILQEQKQEERRDTLAAVADDLGKQELRQNEQRRKLTANISELHKQEAHKLKAQEGGQEHGVPERGHEHQTQENGQEDRVHGNGAYEGGYEDISEEVDARLKVMKERQRKDLEERRKRREEQKRKLESDDEPTPTDEAQEVVQEDKAHEEEQDGSAYEDDVQEYSASYLSCRQRGKRRVRTEESDDSAALRAQQVREGRKPVGKGKYQRLNRFGPSNHDMNPEGDTSKGGTGEGETTPI